MEQKHNKKQTSCKTQINVLKFLPEKNKYQFTNKFCVFVTKLQSVFFYFSVFFN